RGRSRSNRNRPRLVALRSRQADPQNAELIRRLHTVGVHSIGKRNVALESRSRPLAKVIAHVLGWLGASVSTRDTEFVLLERDLEILGSKPRTHHFDDDVVVTEPNVERCDDGVGRSRPTASPSR